MKDGRSGAYHGSGHSNMVKVGAKASITMPASVKQHANAMRKAWDADRCKARSRL